MASDLDLDVVIRLATQGAKGSIDQVTQLGTALNGLNKSGKLDDKGWEKNSAAVSRYAQATGKATQAQNTLNDSTVRYASYDLSRTMFTLAAGILAVGTAFTVAAASQESAFTEVERIVGGTVAQTTELKNELLTLSTEIPKSFEDLTAIAALGAALDIPRESLTAFTKTVAEFAAVTGVSTEAAATGFGRLSQYLEVPAEDFEKLGSAILKAGNISVATEEQVLKFSQSLALPAARAGLAADQVVALGATLASFGNINVEGAGSALNRVFTNIDRQIDSGGEKLEGFADLAGISANKFGAAWENDAGTVFNKVIAGLNGDIGNLSGNLDDLGIRNVRDRRIIEALVINYEAYSDILRDTSQAYQDGTYQGSSYGKVLDDLASQWQIFINGAMNAAAAIGSQTLPAMGALLEIGQDLLGMFVDFATSDFGSGLIQILTPIAALVAGYAALRGALALGTAAMIGFRQATLGIGITSLLGQVKYLAGSLLGLSTVLATGSRFMVGVTAAGKGLSFMFAGLGSVITGNAGRMLGLSAAAAGGKSALLGLGGAVKGLVGLLGPLAVALAAVGIFEWIDRLNLSAEAQEGIVTSLSGMNDAFKTTDQIISALESKDMEGLFGQGGSYFDAMANATDNLGQSLDRLANGPDFGQIAYAWTQEGRSFTDWLTTAGTALGTLAQTDLPAAQAAFGKLATQYGLTDRQQRTFIQGSGEYKTVLEGIAESAGVAATAENLRLIALGKGVGASALATAAANGNEDAIAALGGTAEDAKDQIKALADEVRNFSNEAITTEESQDALTGKINSLGDAAEDAGYDLKGASTESLGYRAALRDLGTQAQDTAADVLENGGSVDDAISSYKRGRKALVDELTPAFNGNRDAAIEHADALFGTSADNIANIRAMADSIKSDMDRLDDLEADPKVNANTDGFKRGIDGVNRDLDRTNGRSARPRIGARDGGFQRVLSNARRGLSGLDGMVARPSIQIAGIGAALSAIGMVQGRLAATSAIRAAAGVFGFASGGYTGSGGKYEPAGVVHKGEYVIPKQHVNQTTGLPYADALGKLSKGMQGSTSYAGGGYVAPPANTGVVSLSAGSIQAIARAVQPHLILDGREIAQSTSNQFQRSTSIGAS